MEHSPPLDVLVNLARLHREHEKFYAAEPLRDAEAVLRWSRVLKSLADRWERTRVVPGPADGVPFAGCEDLNDNTAIETGGVLFLEGGGEPAELTRLKEDLAARSRAAEQGGAWLSQAMTAAWELALTLLNVPQFADLLGDRHRIIANNTLAADLSRLVGMLLRRAVDILAVVDFAPGALRADLAGPRRVPGYLYSASELLDRAADLAVTATTLTRDSERAWRAWRARVESLRDGAAPDGGAPHRQPDAPQS